MFDVNRVHVEELVDVWTLVRAVIATDAMKTWLNVNVARGDVGVLKSLVRISK